MRPKLYFLKSRTFYAILVAFLILAGLTNLHLTMLAKNFVVDETGAFRTTSAGYGDIPLHLTQISKFAFDKLDNLNEPIYYGEKLHYPFILNLISGLFLRLTHAWRFSVMFPAMALALGNIILLFVLYRKLIKNYIIAALAVCLFMLGTGFGGYTLVKDAINKGQSWSEFTQNLQDKSLSTITRWDAKYPQQNIGFGAPMSLVFLHQRPFLLGLFGLLVLLLLLLKALEAKHGKKYLIWTGLIFGALPLMHTHTFVVAVVVVGSGILLALLKPYRYHLKKLLIIAGIGVIVALPQIFFLVDFSQTLTADAHFVNFRLGWMSEPTIGSVQFVNGQRDVFSLAFIKFLWINFGVILPAFLVILAGAVVFRKRLIGLSRSKNTFLLYFSMISGLFLLLVVQLVRLQPWDYDTNKLLVYYQLFAAGIVMYFLWGLYEKFKIVGTVVITIFFAVAISSGVIDELPRYMIPYDRLPVIFDTNAQQLSKLILQTIPEDQLILTGTSHLNPVSSLAGRGTLAGYPGWLWTRGIDYGPREAEIKVFYANPSRYSLILQKYPIEYILLDYQVTNDYGAVLEVFQQNFTEIFHAGQYSLFKL